MLSVLNVLKKYVVLICATKVIYRGISILLAFCSGNMINQEWVFYLVY